MEENPKEEPKNEENEEEKPKGFWAKTWDVTKRVSIWTWKSLSHLFIKINYFFFFSCRKNRSMAG